MGRTLLILIVLAVVVLVATGVIYVTQNNNTTTINFDKEKLHELGDKAKQEGREVIDKTGQAIEQAGEKIQKSPPAGDTRP